MSRFSAAIFALLAIAVPVSSQSKPSPVAATTPSERRAALTIESVRNSPLELRNLLFKMPKGSDLHNHLYGAIYAETWIRNAAEDNMCLDSAAMRGTSNVYSRAEGNPPACSDGKVPAAHAFKDQHLYDNLVDAFSIRAFVPASSFSSSAFSRRRDSFAFHGISGSYPRR